MLWTKYIILESSIKVFIDTFMTVLYCILMLLFLSMLAFEFPGSLKGLVKITSF